GGGQAVYVGAHPDLLALKRAWRIDGRFPQASGEVLLGSEVAREHRVRAGQTFALPGLSGGPGILPVGALPHRQDAWATVSGVLRPTGGSEDLFIHMPLADAQRMFHRPGQLTHVLVRLRD